MEDVPKKVERFGRMVRVVRWEKRRDGSLRLRILCGVHGCDRDVWDDKYLAHLERHDKSRETAELRKAGIPPARKPIPGQVPLLAEFGEVPRKKKRGRR